MKEKQVNDLNNLLDEFTPAFDTFVKNISSFIFKFKENWLSLKNHTYSLQYFDNLAEDWSNNNLCMMFNAPLKIFIDKPIGKQQIITLLNKYSRGNKLLDIFRKIEEIKILNINDVQEMEFAYKRKKYKSCCILLFSFIDAVILSLQNDTRKNGKKELPNHIDRIKLKNSTNEFPLFYYEYQMLLKNFTKLYYKGENFSNEARKSELNRNYIIHGMSTRTITKYDCLKLMYLLISEHNYFSENIKN